MADDDVSGDLPEDPFPTDVPDFEDFTGPYADEIRALISKYAESKDVYKALVTQQSLRELGSAVWALDEETARKALLCAICFAVGGLFRNDPDRFAKWVEQQ
jgi:hypothetical protein